jgi:hypothetical protein
MILLSSSIESQGLSFMGSGSACKKTMPRICRALMNTAAIGFNVPRTEALLAEAGLVVDQADRMSIDFKALDEMASKAKARNEVSPAGQSNIFQ